MKTQNPPLEAWQGSIVEQMNTLALLVQQLFSGIPNPKPVVLGRNPDNDMILRKWVLTAMIL
jgi:hypothetical protein